MTITSTARLPIYFMNFRFPLNKVLSLPLAVGILTGVVAAAGFANAATSIGTNISADGTLSVAGTTGTTTIAAGQGVTVGSSQFVVQQGSGNVGIGTTSPSSLLAVEGNIISTGSVFIGGSTGQFTIRRNIEDNNLNLSGGSAAALGGNIILNGSTKATNAGVIQFRNSGTEAMRIAASGHVGIGVTAPTVSLQVATTTSNATTTVEIGKTGQNKGTCLVLYDVSGAVQYVTVQGGALVVSAASCK